jgi:hypothetical protein
MKRNFELLPQGDQQAFDTRKELKEAGAIGREVDGM